MGFWRFAIFWRYEFKLATICHRLISFFHETLFEFVPIYISANDSTPLEYDWGQLMRDVQWRLYLYAKSKFPDVEFSVPRVRYNGGIRTKGYSDIQIWQSSTYNGSKILFQFRAGTCQKEQSQFPQMLPSELPNYYVQENICDIEDMDKSLFKDFLKE